MATDPQASNAALPQSHGLRTQLIRFVLIGGFCALIDFGLYWLLLHNGLEQLSIGVHLAKAISFIAGTTTAFFLNRRFTFQAAQNAGAAQLGGFVVLYVTTFWVNVGTNALALHLLPEIDYWEKGIAWVIAQGAATTINFVMLKWVVFREPRTESHSDAQD